MAETAAAGSRARCRTGPCSMCTSTYAATSAGSSVARSTAARVPSKPFSRRASRKESPSASATRSKTSSGTAPTRARDPRKVDPNRTPSSSEKPTTWIGRGRFAAPPYSRTSALTAAMPRTTPSAPSYLPASRTVSRWEPTRTAAALGREEEEGEEDGGAAAAAAPSTRPWTFPASSVHVRMPASRIHASATSIARRDAGLRNVRSSDPSLASVISPSSCSRSHASRSSARDASGPKPTDEPSAARGDAATHASASARRASRGAARNISRHRGGRGGAGRGVDVSM